jgi:membrane fusion protein (multidrug efflux system)
VEKGMPLVQLDPEPRQVLVDQRQAELASAKAAAAQQIAALAVAQANLDQARTQVRAQLAGLKASWYLVASVQDFVRYEEAALASNVANLNQQEASLKLAQQEYDRLKTLSSQAVSEDDIDQKKSALDVAQAQVASAQATIDQTRALLGTTQDAGNPTTVPSDVAQTFNGTRYAVASFEQAMSGLGLSFDSVSPQLSGLKDKYESLALDVVVENAPDVKVAKARLDQAKAGLAISTSGDINIEDQPAVTAAEKALAEANLELAYTQIDAPISGFVSGRNVNPGNNVAAGQALLAIRPLDEVWVDADFKETQLADIRIGQKVDLYVDAYPGKVFQGHVHGFSSGTGAVMSLLPPENATGNFVKVVQRLPVRIAVDAQTPDEMKEYPLFAGLSVEPDVDIKSAPQGPDAGQRLLGLAPGSIPTVAQGEPGR